MIIMIASSLQKISAGGHLGTPSCSPPVNRAVNTVTDPELVEALKALVSFKDWSVPKTEERSYQYIASVYKRLKMTLPILLQQRSAKTNAEREKIVEEIIAIQQQIAVAGAALEKAGIKRQLMLKQKTQDLVEMKRGIVMFMLEQKKQLEAWSGQGARPTLAKAMQQSQEVQQISNEINTKIYEIQMYLQALRATLCSLPLHQEATLELMDIVINMDRMSDLQSTEPMQNIETAIDESTNAQNESPALERQFYSLHDYFPNCNNLAESAIKALEIKDAEDLFYQLEFIGKIKQSTSKGGPLEMLRAIKNDCDLYLRKRVENQIKEWDMQKAAEMVIMLIKARYIDNIDDQDLVCAIEQMINLIQVCLNIREARAHITITMRAITAKIWEAQIAAAFQRPMVWSLEEEASKLKSAIQDQQTTTSTFNTLYNSEDLRDLRLNIFTLSKDLISLSPGEPLTGLHNNIDPSKKAVQRLKTEAPVESQGWNQWRTQQSGEGGRWWVEALKG